MKMWKKTKKNLTAGWDEKAHHEANRSINHARSFVRTEKTQVPEVARGRGIAWINMRTEAGRKGKKKKKKENTTWRMRNARRRALEMEIFAEKNSFNKKLLPLINVWLNQIVFYLFFFGKFITVLFLSLLILLYYFSRIKIIYTL